MTVTGLFAFKEPRNLFQLRLFCENAVLLPLGAQSPSTDKLIQCMKHLPFFCTGLESRKENSSLSCLVRYIHLAGTGGVTRVKKGQMRVNIHVSHIYAKASMWAKSRVKTRKDASAEYHVCTFHLFLTPLKYERFELIIGKSHILRGNPRVSQCWNIFRLWEQGAQPSHSNFSLERV